MSEKYIDLADAIKGDRGWTRAAIESILEWLDGHPDQVPGRTITESKFADSVDASRVSVDGVSAPDFLEALGITVIPCPEPALLPSMPGATVKMRKHHQWVRTVTGAWISTDGSILDEDGAQEIANEHGFEVIHDGVTVLGGDDDH